eukprot:TRINITY_DN6846_c0_g1_i1.p1 TRINITY_DN6846_c0_g1~~TRINITY_DN6846_c0_g1_i1.p1  ORF type:complete len:344 (+),score=47.06 TRINITY_DN6846_c0_g1_i1:152-1033(+)
MFKKKELLEKQTSEKILRAATELLKKLPTVVDLKITEKKTVTVVGDTHGQVHDVLTIFEQQGLPTKDRSYLFNGDYVDRGDQGCEVVLLLCSWMLTDPSSLTMLRGNHEDRSITGMYGFYEEAKKKYGVPMYELYMGLFSVLPYAAVLQSKILVLHGGLFRSPSDPSCLAPFSDLRNIPASSRGLDIIPDTGIVTDVLWSDPVDVELCDNTRRGSGCFFPDELACEWLDAEGFLMLVRSHEGPDLQDLSNGYSARADGRVVTVFSATNYCGTHGNKGAVAVFGKDLHPKFVSF